MIFLLIYLYSFRWLEYQGWCESRYSQVSKGELPAVSVGMKYTVPIGENFNAQVSGEPEKTPPETFSQFTKIEIVEIPKDPNKTFPFRYRIIHLGDADRDRFDMSKIYVTSQINIATLDVYESEPELEPESNQSEVEVTENIDELIDRLAIKPVETFNQATDAVTLFDYHEANMASCNVTPRLFAGLETMKLNPDQNRLQGSPFRSRNEIQQIIEACYSALNPAKKENVINQFKKNVTKFTKASQTFGIPEPLLLCTSFRESQFDESARGGKEDLGLMQMIPSTFAHVSALLSSSDFSKESLLKYKAKLADLIQRLGPDPKQYKTFEAKEDYEYLVNMVVNSAMVLDLREKFRAYMIANKKNPDQKWAHQDLVDPVVSLGFASFYYGYLFRQADFRLNRVQSGNYALRQGNRQNMIRRIGASMLDEKEFSTLVSGMYNSGAGAVFDLFTVNMDDVSTPKLEMASILDKAKTSSSYMKFVDACMSKKSEPLCP